LRKQETVMSGYKITNYFPELTTDEEWQEFARDILKIINNQTSK